MNVDEHQQELRSGLKVVCEECGSLSIKPIDPASAPDDVIRCRRCDAVRGTVADLRDLARRGTNSFEF